MTVRKSAAVALLAAVGVFAQAAKADDTSSASQTFTINGTAAPVCLLGTPNASGSNNATFSANTITLTQFIDSSTALVNDASMTLETSKAMCNYNAWLSVSSQNGGLKPNNATPVLSGSGGFLTLVPYTVDANWGAVHVSLDTSSGNTIARVQAGGANSGSLSLVIATHKSSLPVVQGNYSDVVTVKLGASM
jgi:hypothetical protein